MEILALSRLALFISAAAILAACGGSQPPIGAPGAMPQSRAITTHAGRGGSWMLPRIDRAQSLIYVLADTKVYMVSYSHGTIEGTFSNPGGWWGMCSDNSGDVFITANGSVLEYKHGGATPIASLEDENNVGEACSVDSTTGNLAVTNEGDVAIYQRATGNPTFLTDPSITNYFSCAYDGTGNLIIDGDSDSKPDHLATLPAGSTIFQDLALPQLLNMGDLQWDGRYIALSDVAHDVYQISISGSQATVVGKTVLHSTVGLHRAFWLQRSVLLSPTGPDHDAVGLWSYPKGGKPTARYFVVKKADLSALTVSVAPSR
jgi:hypothetical protein